jgi:hypothetical protein
MYDAGHLAFERCGAIIPGARVAEPSMRMRPRRDTALAHLPADTRREQTAPRLALAAFVGDEGTLPPLILADRIGSGTS